MSRATIVNALFMRLTSAGNFATIGERLVYWTEVAEQPALFVRYTGDEYAPRLTRMPAKVVVECEVWLYTKAGENPAVPPAIALAGLVDMVEQLLAPGPNAEAQTLGGQVTHCWIEGRTDIHPGDLDGQAIAVIPVKILVPSINGG
jgi:hypothetical protein